MSLFRSESENTGGDRLPYVKYNSKAGRIYRVDREQIGDSWSGSETEITNGFSAIMDFENIEIGWLNFPTGAAPQFAVARIGDAQPARPSTDFKEGFVLTLKLSASCAGGKAAVRQLSGNAKVVRAGIDEIYTAYLAGRDANPGMVPVVAMTGSTPVVTDNKHGKQTNYQPVFQITKWVKRPEDLVYTATPVAKATPAVSPDVTASWGAPPSTGSTPAAPPAARLPVLADEEF